MKQVHLKKKSETNWEKLASMPDSTINFSDVSELDGSFFEKAEIRLPKPKKAVSLRLDDDILNWFKNQGKGYQTRINAVLRLYVQTTARKASSFRTPYKRPLLRRRKKH